MADREFIGSEWLGYLNARRHSLPYQDTRELPCVSAWSGNTGPLAVQRTETGESKHLDGIYYVNGQACYLSGSKIKDKEGAPELQILVSYCNAEEAFEMYKLRWQVETMFKGMKSSGFDIEGSMSVTIPVCQSLCHHHDCVCLVLPRRNLYQRIHQTDNGAEAQAEGCKSIQVRTGLHLPVLVNHTNRYRIDVFKFLSYT